MDDKVQAIKENEQGKLTKSEIAQKYGIANSTLTAWLKNKEKILQHEMSFSPSCKRMRTGQHPELEKALVAWITNARSKNYPIDGPYVLTKAKLLAEKMVAGSLELSDGWLMQLRLCIVSRSNPSTVKQVPSQVK